MKTLKQGKIDGTVSLELIIGTSLVTISGISDRDATRMVELMQHSSSVVSAVDGEQVPHYSQAVWDDGEKEFVYATTNTGVPQDIVEKILRKDCVGKCKLIKQGEE